ncbi:hypothetical protein HUO13_01545 [Saccharopolyspora erythraea]|uniref:IniB N-terminal domain-containing protein n=1 Tax=Saccharopolyspora erythraea TaxID=1836 RepID=UPI001BAD1136|nr:IniB N-terminal domain-containing protein [Saccharopolyspora erythraea]QUG99653.1 hypothetical protein HUO13_01545 [Saccharopolyspora erythraea]
MPHSQPEGRAETFASSPGTQFEADQPTLHEFLTRLVSDPAARSAFDTDPHATLDQAGLGGMTATDVLQAASLVLDYAPVEVVQEYDRSLQSSVEKFAASTQHVAINQLHPVHPLEQEELTMLHNSSPQAPDFSQGGDVDKLMPQPAPESKGGDVNVDIEQNDSHNLISVHHIASDNNIGNIAAVGNVVGDVVGDTANTVVGTVGDVAYGSVSQVTNTVDNSVDMGGDLVAGAGSALIGGDVNIQPVNEVTNVVGDVTNVAGDLTGGDVTDVAGNVTGVAGDLPVVGGVANTVGGVAGDLPVVGDVAGAAGSGELPVVGDVAGTVGGVAGGLPVVGDVAGAAGSGELPVVGDVAGTVGGVTDLAGGVTGGLPVVGDVAPAISDPSALPVVGGVAGELPVDDVAGALPVDDVADTVGGVTDTVGGVTSALPVDDVTSNLPVDDVTSALPVNDVTSHLPAPSDLPVVGPVAGGAVEQIAGEATSALPLDGLL